MDSKSAFMISCCWMLMLYDSHYHDHSTEPGPVSDVIVTLTLSPETEAEERAGSGQWRDSGQWTPTPEPGAGSRAVVTRPCHAPSTPPSPSGASQHHVVLVSVPLIMYFLFYPIKCLLSSILHLRLISLFKLDLAFNNVKLKDWSFVLD